MACILTSIYVLLFLLSSNKISKFLMILSLFVYGEIIYIINITNIDLNNVFLELPFAQGVSFKQVVAGVLVGFTTYFIYYFINKYQDSKLEKFNTVWYIAKSSSIIDLSIILLLFYG